MPFKSKAQRRKFAELLVKGEISEETYEEWNRETGSKELPEYANAGKVRPSRKRASPQKAASKTKRKSPTKAKPKSRSKSKPKSRVKGRKAKG